VPSQNFIRSRNLGHYGPKCGTKQVRNSLFGRSEVHATPGLAWHGQALLLRQLGNHGLGGAIVVRREIGGFILNRLQAVLLSEACRLVGEGYVSPQHLNHTVKEGLALRWSFNGAVHHHRAQRPVGISDYCLRYGVSEPSERGGSRDLLRQGPRSCSRRMGRGSDMSYYNKTG
jgi:hypothetical protein